MSNMKSTLTLVGVAILGGVFGSLATGWLKPSGSAPHHQVVAEGRVPTHYIVRESKVPTRESGGLLAQSLATLADRVEALEAMFDEEPVDPSAEAPLVSPAEAQATARMEAMAKLEAFDASFREEARDPSWSDGMTRQIQEAFDHGDFHGSQVLSNECRATSCRVEVSHDSEDSRLQFQLIRRQIAGSGFMQHVHEEGSKDRTVAYFLREGRERDNAIARSFLRTEEPSSAR